MTLLLDTQIYLWCLAESPKLRDTTRALILNADVVYVSSASIWEACIKIGIGKLDADPAALVNGIKDSGFIELPVSARHAARVATLPAYHKDPFDRLLVAQALEEPMRLLSSDGNLREYTELVQLVDL